MSGCDFAVKCTLDMYNKIFVHIVTRRRHRQCMIRKQAFDLPWRVAVWLPIEILVEEGCVLTA